MYLFINPNDYYIYKEMILHINPNDYYIHKEYPSINPNELLYIQGDG